MIVDAALCTREDVKAAVDIKLTARVDAQVDRAIMGATLIIEGALHRSFIPWHGTRYFNFPAGQYARPWVLWLDQHELASVSSLVSGGVTIAAADYFLEPNGQGPPYNRIEIDQGSSAAFAAGATTQQAIAVTGVFCGCRTDTAAAGALAEALDDSETGVDVTDSSVIGVGDLIMVDSERMVVAEKGMLDTGVDIHASDSLTAQASDVSVTLTTTSGAPVPGEVILIDSERMLVVDAAGTTLTVKRPFDGSVLAAHAAGASVYAPRTLTVTRGARGTTAAAHSLGAAVTRHVVPGLIRQLAVGEAVAMIMQESAGWARTAGSGDNEREVMTRGLGVLREQAYTALARQARIRAV